MANRRASQRGNSLIEFTLVGIPLIFILISTFEISRGMWHYHTLAYAVRDAARYAAVHGYNCGASPHACQIRVSDLARKVESAGVGLLPDNLTVTIQSSTRTIGPATLTALKANSECFPTASDCSGTVEAGGMAGQPVTITAIYPFQSAIAMFAPGNRPIVFGTFNLPASARERIAF